MVIADTNQSRNVDILAGHGTYGTFAFWSCLVGVAKCIQDDLPNLICAFAIGDISVLVVNIKYVH